MPLRFVYGCAVSLDGFIADSEGRVGWLDRFHGNYGGDYFKRSDVLVMGRITYEQGIELGWRGEKKKRVFVLSRTRAEGPYADEFWSGSVAALAERIRKGGASYVWMMGGGLTASSFVEARALTNLSLTVMPVVLGSGVKLFGPLSRPLSLTLARSKSFPDGVTTLDYEVSP